MRKTISKKNNKPKANSNVTNLNSHKKKKQKTIVDDFYRGLEEKKEKGFFQTIKHYFSDLFSNPDSSSLEDVTALTTSIVAVFLAISSILGDNADSSAIVYREYANDQWNFYQAKSIKENVYEGNRFFLQIEYEDSTDARKEKVQKMLKDFENKMNKYKAEKEEIKLRAQTYERLSRASAKKDDAYDFAEGFYQVSIILSAISVLMKKKKLLVLSWILGIIGFGLSAYAFLMP